MVSPGSRSTPLAVALYRQLGIEVTVVLDERSAGFYALGAAYASREPVALLCTSGTAAANYHPAVAEASLSAVPLLVLTADRPPELRGNGSGQAIDQIKLYGSAVRWFAEVGSHEADDRGLIHMRSIACRAWAASAGDPRPGPVHLNFPFRDPLDPSPRPGAITATDELAVKGRGEQPLTAVTRSAPSASSDELNRIAVVAAASERPLILAGRQTDPELRQPLATLAATLGAPVLAEPSSQLRTGPHDRSAVICRYDRIIERLVRGDDPAGASELAPDLVIRFGETPTSKNLRIWLAALRDVSQVVVDPDYGWYEPSRVADLIVRAEPTAVAVGLASDLNLRDTGERRSRFLELWLGAERDTAGAVVEDEALTPRRAHEEIARALLDGDLLYSASSMAVRDQESFLPSGPRDVLFLANRGANGIDGTLASGAGAAAAAGRPTTIVIGDLAFQHDVGSLALVAASTVPIAVVVINDGGGRIFSRLPQKTSMPAEEFETLMRTPSRLDLAAAATTFGLSHARIGDPEQLESALRGRSTRILEVAIADG